MSTDSKLSKLWKTEDWLACWLGFIVIAIAAVAVLTQAFAFSGQKKLDISFDEPVTSIMPSWEQGRYWVAGESSLSEIKVQ